MPSELENLLTQGVRETIEQGFRKKIKDMDSEEKTEVFLLLYKTLSLLMMKDFNMIEQLVINDLTFIKPEKKDVISENNTKPRADEKR